MTTAKSNPKIQILAGTEVRDASNHKLRVPSTIGAEVIEVRDDVTAVRTDKGDLWFLLPKDPKSRPRAKSGFPRRKPGKSSQMLPPQLVGLIVGVSILWTLASGPILLGLLIWLLTKG